MKNRSKNQYLEQGALFVEERIIEKVVRIGTEYEIRYELVLSHFEDLPPDHRVRLVTAYTLGGDLIGEPMDAAMLSRYGIAPEIAEKTHTICSIGWCEKEQKWYGWSCRAICGFGIGSFVKKGDCAYMPTNPQDLLRDHVEFWTNDEDEFTTKTVSIQQKIGVLDPNGNFKGPGVLYEYECTRKKDNVLLKSTHFRPYPDKWGKGEWTAESIEDAKQMACAFAAKVS